MTSTASPRNQTIWNAVVGLVLATPLIVLLSQSWMRWFDLYIDSLRDVWVAEQIRQGKSLYKDVYYENGIFVPHLFGALFRLFGTHFSILVYSGIAITISTTAAVYGVTHQLIKPVDQDLWKRIVPALTSLLFLLVCVLSPSSVLFNYIIPYTQSTTLFVLFALVALYSFLRWLQNPQRRWIISWVLAITLAATCRPMMLMPVAVAFSMTWAVVGWHQHHGVTLPKVLAILGLPILSTTMLYAIVLAYHGAANDFLQHNVLHAIWAKDVYFSRFQMGLTDLGESLSLIAYAAAHYVLFLLAFSAASRWLGRIRRQQSTTWVWGLLCGALVAVMLWVIDPFVMSEQFRVLTVLLGLGTLHYGWRAIRRGDIEDIALLSLMLVSLSVGTRIVFRMTPIDYGFCLVVPGLIAYIILFFRTAVQLIGPDDSPSWRIHFGVLASAVLLFFGVQYTFRALDLYAPKTFSTTTAYGTLTTDDTPRNRYFWQAITYLNTHASESASVAVIPEGIGINLISQRPSPMKYVHVNSHVADQIDTEAFIGTLQASSMEWVVIPNRFSREYDHALFGIDYHRELYEWVQRDFTLVKQFGAAPTEYRQHGLQIWRRNR